MTGGAIVPAYNNPGCDVKMTQTQLADVFLGKITNWSFGCADKNILLFIVLMEVAPPRVSRILCLPSLLSGKKTVGTGKAVMWLLVSAVKVTSGVAASIKNQPGAIGYLNYGYVNGGKFQQVALQNKAGNFVTANAETSAAGLATNCIR